MTETTVVKLRGDEISVSARQAARLIGLPLRTLQAETKAGKIPAARRIGRRYVYLIEELKRMGTMQLPQEELDRITAYFAPPSFETGLPDKIPDAGPPVARAMAAA